MHSSEKGHQELLEILNRYKSGLATEEEKLFVEKYFEHLQQQPDILDSYSDIEKAILENELKTKLLTSIESSSLVPVYQISYIKKWQKLAVAAVLLSMIFVAAILWNKKPSSDELSVNPVSAGPAKDKSPGGNKAILTLADGSVITLDSIQIGTLARQGNTIITKDPNGQLFYNPDAKKDSIVLFNTLTTPRGGQYKVFLPDGTAVWLNSASSITYPVSFTSNERNVSITGEAYFEVAKQKNMPFKVKVNSMEVEVLGTHFNIMAYEDEPIVRTTLIEGSVKLSNVKEKKTMKPGQQIDLNREGIMNYIQTPDIEQALAWKNGMFVFRNTNIKTIMRQVSRWYDMEIELGKDLDDLEFNGVVSRKEYVSQLLKILETTGSVHFSIDGKKIRVNP